MPGLISSAVHKHIKEAMANGNVSMPNQSIPAKRQHPDLKEAQTKFDDDYNIHRPVLPATHGLPIASAEVVDLTDDSECHGLPVDPRATEAMLELYGNGTFPTLNSGKRHRSATDEPVAIHRRSLSAHGPHGLPSVSGPLTEVIPTSDDDHGLPIAAIPHFSPPSAKRFRSAPVGGSHAEAVHSYDRALPTPENTPKKNRDQRNHTEIVAQPQQKHIQEQTLPTPDSTPQKTAGQQSWSKTDSQVVDLTDDDDTANDEASSPSRRQDSFKQTVSTPGCASQQDGNQHNQPVAGGYTQSAPNQEQLISAPESTSQNETGNQKSPDISDRYIINVIDGVEHSNPYKFSLKPAYWTKWTGRDFTLLAEYIRTSFDAVEFAQEIGRPVDEVKHVFSAAVVNALYDVKKAQGRQKEGMYKLMELYNDHGTPNRPWGKKNAEGSRKFGELCRINNGSVHVIDAKHGGKLVFSVDELSEVDITYLEQELTAEDKRILWA